MWYAICVVLILGEILGIGIAVLAKSEGYSTWYIALIPVYGVGYFGKIAGVFKVFNVPVKNFTALFIELSVIALLCGLYWHWGKANLTPKGYKMLGQIMVIPIAVCLGVMYLSAVKASWRVFSRYRLNPLALYKVISLFIVPIPFILIGIRNKEHIVLSQFYN